MLDTCGKMCFVERFKSNSQNYEMNVLMVVLQECNVLCFCGVVENINFGDKKLCLSAMQMFFRSVTREKKKTKAHTQLI